MKSAIAVCLAATVMLAGCGQRGPLYLPDQAPAKKRLSSQASFVPALSPPHRS